MPRYRDSFRFTPKDIELIEGALRDAQSRHVTASLGLPPGAERQAAAREISLLLAKIYHQKIFWSQVQEAAIPGG